jgi:hypothetical protein
VINIVPGLLVVAAFVVIAVVGLTLVQRKVPSHGRQQHNDVAGCRRRFRALLTECGAERLELVRD